jgi:stage II sporulation protein D
MRRWTTLTATVAVALIVGSTGPLALAAGPGTVVPGATEDPFTGFPPSGSSTQTSRTTQRSGFTFYGSGYGHGIGMSQWGAYGLARKGWSYKRILTQFYRGTRVARDPTPVGKIRVGLTWDRSVVHLTAKAGPVRLWVTRSGGRLIATIPSSRTWVVKATATGFAIRDGDGALVGGQTWGGAAFPLFVTYAEAGSRVFVPEADAIWGKGFSYNRGVLEFNLYRHGGGWRERVILPIKAESYLYGIGEMPSSWPPGALRTQAVAARTFATYTVERYGIRAECNCDLTDGSNDQTYIGFGKEGGPMGARWVRAVDATRGQVVTFGGKVIQAFYAASDGGHSDSVEDVWHGGDPAFAIPYLKAECDPGEYTSANPWTDWKRSLSASELTGRLAPYTGGIGTVQGFSTIRRGQGGRIISLRANGSSSSAVVTGSELRAAIGAWDGRIWIGANQNIVGPIRATYDALMCRPGLPTTKVTSIDGGARQRFQRGGIYRNGVADVTVWLHGPIDTEYLGVGGAPGRLGLPTTSVVTLKGPGGGAIGARISFHRGRIYSKAPAAHALWGRVLAMFVDRGGAVGALGFPTTRVHADGSGGTLATFEHGTIRCPSAGPCSVST